MIIARRAGAATRSPSSAASTAGDERAAQGRPRGETRAVLSACRTFVDPVAGSGARRTSSRRACRAAGYAHCAGDAARVRASARVGECGHRRVGARTIQRSYGVEPVLLDEPAQQWVVRRSRAGNPWRRSPAAPPLGSRLDAEATRAPARSSGSSHARPGGYDGASEAVQAARRALGAAPSGSSRESALREERPWHVQRPARRLAAANRDDVGAGCERIQPFGRGGHSRADDGDAVGVVVRLVGVDGARVALELGREREAGMTGCEQDMAERSVAVEREPPSSTRTRSMRRRSDKLASQPLRSRSSSTCRRNSATDGR